MNSEAKNGISPMRPVWRSQSVFILISVLLASSLSMGIGANETFFLILLLPFCIVIYRRYAHHFRIKNGQVEHHKGIITKEH